MAPAEQGGSGKWTHLFEAGCVAVVVTLETIVEPAASVVEASEVMVTTLVAALVGFSSSSSSEGSASSVAAASGSCLTLVGTLAPRAKSWSA